MRVKDIKKGQIFCEACYGLVARFEATEDAREVPETKGRAYGHECVARCLSLGRTPADGSDVVTFFEADPAYCGGLKLYAEVPSVPA
jgi:hypothetical protein